MYKVTNDFCGKERNGIVSYKYIKGKYGALFCEKCKNYTIFKVKYKYSYKAFANEELDCRMKFSFTCPHCEHRNENIDEYDLYDPNIAHTIYILNKKNYVTKACCEGHDGYAYILFGQNEYKQIFEQYPLPYPWYMDTDIGTRMDYINPKLVIRANTDIQDALDYIQEWADSLPVWDKPVKTENSHDYYIQEFDAILL